MNCYNEYAWICDIDVNIWHMIYIIWYARAWEVRIKSTPPALGVPGLGSQSWALAFRLPVTRHVQGRQIRLLGFPSNVGAENIRRLHAWAQSLPDLEYNKGVVLFGCGDANASQCTFNFRQCFDFTRVEKCHFALSHVILHHHTKHII